MHNHSYENEFNLHVNEISFSYERMSTKTRFEKEAKGNLEMAYYLSPPLICLSTSLLIQNGIFWSFILTAMVMFTKETGSMMCVKDMGL